MINQFDEPKSSVILAARLAQIIWPRTRPLKLTKTA